ncbi:hypothetical protein ISTM_442 [Insectomime virus]|nr:hypothetical protein ISTM_442 [Insectomime virus]
MEQEPEFNMSFQPSPTFTATATPMRFEVKQMSPEEREKALEYAHVLVQKINDRLEAEFPINIDFNSSSVFLSFVQGGTLVVRQLASIGRNNVLMDGRVLYPIYDTEDAISVSEEDVIERAVSVIKSDQVYSNNVVSKKLDTLNNNFSKLFDFLRESVELVPGSEQVNKLSESFEKKANN